MTNSGWKDGVTGKPIPRWKFRWWNTRVGLAWTNRCWRCLWNPYHS